VQLFLLGFLILFLELTLIRYLPGSIWNLGYFPNLVLLAVFLGMSLGFVFHQYATPSRSALIFQAAPFALLALVAFVYYWRPVVPGFERWAGDIGGELYFTSTPKRTAAASDTLVFGFCFAAILLVFAAISQRMAKLFREFAPLRAYTLDILGSCGGIVSFMLASWLQLPAFVWFVALVPLFVLAAEATPRRFLLIVPLGLVAALAWHQDTRLTNYPAYDGPRESRWSPYQKLELARTLVARPLILANGISHQDIYSPAEIATSFYSVPYAVRNGEADRPPYRNVLVIGAGSGNDVAAALRAGAEHVDALEIDPVIAELGERYNPSGPYRDPRVSVIVDDGRAFMTRTKRRYDLVVFALTDSLVKVSSMAQLRLENYLFTKEAIARAYELLTDKGDVVLYNYYRQAWLNEKLQGAVHAATGKFAEIIYRKGDFHMFRVGRLSPAGVDSPSAEAKVDVAVDDWPFPYLRVRHIPALYAKAMAIVAAGIALLMLFLHRVGRKEDGTPLASLRTKLVFVLLGAAFLLLETKSVVQFSLLFGTTWLNSSLVFLAVLLLVLAANWTAVLFKKPKALPVLYALLIGSCLVSLVLPLARLLNLESGFLRFVLASLLTFLPIYFANLMFSVTFADQAVPEHVFGWNLMGAALGGVLEYSSMAFGYAALALIVAGCYAAVVALLWGSDAAT